MELSGGAIGGVMNLVAWRVAPQLSFGTPKFGLQEIRDLWLTPRYEKMQSVMASAWHVLGDHWT